MDAKLLEEQVVIGERDGGTRMEIPTPCFWDCVECLSGNRVDATFTFEGGRYVARLPRTSARRAQEILRDWHGVETGETGAR